MNKMGKYSDALKVYYEVEKIQSDIFGINHPPTLTTKKNLANCCYEKFPGFSMSLLRFWLKILRHLKLITCFALTRYAAPFMVKAERVIKIFYTKTTYCLNHG